MSLGTVFSEVFMLPSNAPFAMITRTINVTSPATAKLVFDHAGGDNLGIFLDNVRLTNQSTSTVLLEDNFNFEFPDGPLPLQIVPTLTDVDQGAGDVYNNGSLRLRGSGFIEGGITINFGSQSLADSGVSSGPNVFFGFTQENDAVDLTVPVGAPLGPITVTTVGGTSAAFPLTFAGIVATAQSGTPANALLPSANPGQAITLQGSGFDSTTDVVFPTIDSAGNRSQRVVRPIAVKTDGTELTVVVPLDAAVTGTSAVVGDQNNTQAPLQVISLLSGVDFTSVAADGSSAQVQLRGAGFVEGNGSVYTFGNVAVTDSSTSSSPINVFFGFSQDNDAVNLSLPTTGDFHGAVTVTTAGGTSAPFTVGFSNLTGTATSGTPADATKASANPGQSVTLTGTGLTTSTDLLAQYLDSNGTLITQLLNPSAASGTSATFTVPNQFNGAFAVHVIGSAFAPLLQIVPVVTSLTVTNSNSANRSVQLRGSGFVEGNNSVYDFAGVTVTDTSTSTSPINVFFGFTQDNDTVTLTSLPAYPSGMFTVTTTGGTSAAIPVNALPLSVSQAVTAPLGIPADNAASVTPQTLQPLVQEAFARWAAAGVDPSRLSALDEVAIRITDLADSYLALATSQTIWIDATAANDGWFVDTTPEEASEFGQAVGEWEYRASEDSPASGSVDLLTVLAHELGHLLGLDDRDPSTHAGELMAASLEPGIRRLPRSVDIDVLFARDNLWEDLVLA